jgi:putative methylase
MFKKKIQLEMALQGIPPHKSPKVELEQYSTPAFIAADVLWNALAYGDLNGLKVVDLGCGTGIFTIGAALLGASESVGVDVDGDAVSIAKQQTITRDLDNTRFVVSDISKFNEDADTVIQNPPFGAQKVNRKVADRIFLKKALEIAPVVYSFHMKETQEFIVDLANTNSAQVSHMFAYRFPIPKTYDFHVKEKLDVDVIVLRFERI